MARAVRTNETQYVIYLSFDEANVLQRKFVRYKMVAEKVLAEILEAGIESYPTLAGTGEG